MSQFVVLWSMQILHNIQGLKSDEPVVALWSVRILHNIQGQISDEPIRGPVGCADLQRKTKSSISFY